MIEVVGTMEGEDVMTQEKEKAGEREREEQREMEMSR